jgi:hypothetical protein
VPKPFKITESNKEERQAKLRAEVTEAEMKECTFHPNTMERTNKQLIKQLLQEEDAAAEARQQRAAGGGVRAGA